MSKQEFKLISKKLSYESPEIQTTMIKEDIITTSAGADVKLPTFDGYDDNSWF